MKIAHTADLHVRSLSRHDEMRVVIEAFAMKCEEECVNHIFIGGDVFHTKVSGMSPECVDFLCWTFNRLASVAPTHVILGNHDGVISNRTRQDAITPIVEAIKHPDLHLYKTSGVYEFEPGFYWNVFSLFDREGWKCIKPVSGAVNIACYHGPVQGALTETDWKVEGDITVDDFKDYDFLYLGDIHKFQFLAERDGKPWTGYPGSLVQQNYAEAIEHGFLLWDIDDRDNFDVKFVDLPNPKPYVTFDWSGSVDHVVKQAGTFPAGTRYRIRSRDALTQREMTPLTQRLQQELKATEVTFKSDKQVDRTVISIGGPAMAREDLRNPDVLVRLLKEHHDNVHITDDEWSEVRTQIVHYLGQVVLQDGVAKGTQWSLKNLEFDNTFGYGPGNLIDFSRLTGVVGIFGPNRAGKSSIVGTILYTLFNATDRGSLKNLHVINVRHPYCRAKAMVNVGGIDYEIERQSTRQEYKGQVFAPTVLNVFRLDPDGERVDVAGDDRKDSDKFIRNLLGTVDDCLLTSVAVQDDVKSFINQGSTKRRRDLSRFLDLDILDRMHALAKDDVNANKALLKGLANNDWVAFETSCNKRLEKLEHDIKEKDDKLHDVRQRLHDARAQLTSFNDVDPVTPDQVLQQNNKVKLLKSRFGTVKRSLEETTVELGKVRSKIASIDAVKVEHDVDELKRRIGALRDLETSLAHLRHVHEREATLLQRQQRSLKVLADVPCGDSFPGCKFIKDAFKEKDRVGPQQDRVQRALEKVGEAEAALVELKKDDPVEKLHKIEQLNDLKSRLLIKQSTFEFDIAKFEGQLHDVERELEPAQRRLEALDEALKNDGNVEVVALRKLIDDLERSASGLDHDRLGLATQVGKVKSDLDKAKVDQQRRLEVLRTMKAHELVTQAFSKGGIPNRIIASQLPLINSEISRVLGGIVDFTVELQQDDGDSMEVYIDYGDSRRLIEAGSGMEKTVAALAIRAALVNVSSIPKSDMFIIDESFGPLDAAGVEACNRLLVSLKQYFKTILIISHVEGIKDAADHVVEIAKVEKDASVNWGVQ